MVIIQSIKQDKSEYTVVTNQGSYILAEDVLVSFFITKGKEFSNKEWKEILSRHEIQGCMERALHYLSFKERTVFELKKYLEEKGCFQIEALLQELIVKQYLNDERYVEHYLEYCKNRFKGPYVLEQDLKEKGVNEALIQNSLLEYTDEIQYDICDQLIQKQLKPTKYSLPKFQNSLLQKGATAGFDYGLIKEVIANRREEIISCVDEEEQIQKELVKIKNYPTLKQKQKLMQKGFSYETIAKLIDKLDKTK